MLINLSNHPYSEWQEKQKEAAKQYGETFDLPFPAIDPTGDELYIESISNKYLEKIIKLKIENKNITVHLMGEMTFTFSLIQKLHQQEIRCISSTTQRIVENTKDKKKIITFVFERFRSYSNN